MSITPTQPLSVIWDMETGDPDDFLTLLLLLGHPAVHLKAVTITPGTPAQVGLVRHALRWFDTDLPVGSYSLDHPKPCVSAWHYATLGEVAPSWEADPAPNLLLALCDEQTTLITGGPLKNLATALDLAATREQPFRLGTLVAQGGFAGEGVVLREKQLPKFAGLTVCPSYNLNGAPRAALRVLDSDAIGLRRFVSKNVCHGVVYAQALHALVATRTAWSRSLQRIWQAMEGYFDSHPAGKMLHDPLAACCAITPAIGEWAEVKLYREGNQWGATPHPGSNTWIIVDYHRERFLETLLAT